jgi:hypothetical protein
MFPEILTETLATLLRFDPNGDWHLPSVPDSDATITDWEVFYEELASLAAAAEDAMARIRFVAKRNQQP